MKIWLINPFDPLPGESFRGGRYAALSRMFVKKGHQVVWWTSDFFHASKSYRTKNINPFEGCKINYIHTPEYKKNVSFGRILNHWFYGKRFLKLAEQQNELPDVIIASCPPLNSAASAIKFAHEHNIKCIVDVQDLWPEVFEILFPFIIGKLVLYPLRKYADTIYNSADAIMAVSQNYAKRAISACNNIEKNFFVLYLGVDLELFEKVDTRKVSLLVRKEKGQFWVTFIGTIGRCYDIKTILTAAEMSKVSHKNIIFLIAGDGPFLNKMKAIVRNKNLTNCKLLGFLSFENMVALLKQSDIGINAINTKNCFPNKVFDYMAAGLPILNSKEGELSTVINQYNIGLQYESENPYSLKEKILWFYNNKEQRNKMACNSRILIEEKFNRNIQYQRIVDFVEKIVCEGK